jgi:type VI protein secretion system component Hcp
MESTSQIYLEFELEKGSITGESPIGGYEKRIDIDTFAFEASTKLKTLMEVEKKADGLKRGEFMNNLEISRVTVTKPYDSSSLQLAGMMKGRRSIGGEREGVRFTSATISVDQQYIEIEDIARKYPNQILILTLYDGYIADIKLRTSESGAGAQIVETLELSFHQFEIRYWYEDRDNDGNLLSTWRPKSETYKSQRTIQGT